MAYLGKADALMDLVEAHAATQAIVGKRSQILVDTVV